jgi:hypothetical protein
MPLTADQRKARAQLAAIRRHHGAGAEVPDAAAELEAATLEKHISEVIARAPMLTPEQGERLRRLFPLGPGG